MFNDMFVYSIYIYYADFRSMGYPQIIKLDNFQGFKQPVNPVCLGDPPLQETPCTVCQCANQVYYGII